MKKILSILLAAALLAGLGTVAASAADYWINFDANTTDPSVDGMPDPVLKTETVATTLPEDIPTRDNYVFRGWATTPTGAKAYDPEDIYNVDPADPEDQTLYAIWVRKYQVTYSGNAAPGDTVNNLPDPDTKVAGETLQLSWDVPTRSGYNFKGWATTATGAKAYDPGDDFTDDSIVTGRTLYAVWEATFYTVTFNGNTPAGGGPVTGVPAPQTQDNSLTMTLTDEIPSCAGFDFLGWGKVPGGPEIYSQGGSYTDKASVTLYAIWAANEFTVTFNGNAPTGSTVAGVPAALTKNRGVPLGIPTAEPTCTGYRFGGWALSAADATAGIVKYSAGGNNTTDETVTLFAIWTANAYTVRYNANGGAGGPMADSAHTYGIAKALTANAYTNAPATFAGWATTDDGAALYANGASVTNLTAVHGAVVTLYAVWTAPNRALLQQTITEVEALESWKYTAVSWTDLQAALEAARTVVANANATQLEIDNARNALARAQKDLKTKDLIFSTKYESNFLNWILFIVAFGWLWMWF